MDFVEYIGFTAAICTTTAFFPQVLKTYRTKSTKDLSLGMFFIFSLGVLLWLIYGIILVNYPIIVANTVTLVLACLLLYFKIVYKENK